MPVRFAGRFFDYRYAAGHGMEPRRMKKAEPELLGL